MCIRDRPNTWKNTEVRHTPIHKRINKNSNNIKVVSSAKYCRSTDGHFETASLDYHEGGVCLTKRHSRRLKTMNNGHYISEGGFKYPLPVEYRCNEFNSSRYDRVRMVFEAPDDVVDAVDLGVDEADGRHAAFFDNALTTITKAAEGKVFVELFSKCKDKKLSLIHISEPTRPY